MKICNINRVYRETAPDAEGHGGGGQTPEAEEPVSEPEAATRPDEGQDVIPSEDKEPSLWDSLSDDFDDDENSEEQDDSAQPESQEETTPEAPAEEESESPAETPAEEEPPPEAATSEPEEQPTKTEKAESEPEPEKAPEPPSAEQVAQQRQAMVDKIADHYKLSDADALQMVTDPGKVLPRIQAQMFTDMWYAVKSMMAQELPSLIQQNLVVADVQREKVDSFFQAWPQLNKKEHGKTISQVTRVYSQVNPNATEEEITKYVGMQTMLLHGIVPEGFQPPDTSATPEAPVRPHQPAAVNSVRSEQLSSTPDNVYTAMSMELEEEDLQP